MHTTLLHHWLLYISLLYFTLILCCVCIWGAKKQVAHAYNRLGATGGVYLARKHPSTVIMCLRTYVCVCVCLDVHADMDICMSALVLHLSVCVFVCVSAWNTAKIPSYKWYCLSANQSPSSHVPHDPKREKSAHCFLQVSRKAGLDQLWVLSAAILVFPFQQIKQKQHREKFILIAINQSWSPGQGPLSCMI